jgi:transposase
MRGTFDDQGRLFSYISPEQRVAARHPLRKIRALVREVLSDLDCDFRKLYSTTGRPSIPPEQLLSALLLQVFYGVRSERQLMEQLDYNLLYRWFVGLSPDDAVWDATTFTKNRERLQQGDVFNRFMEKLLRHQDVTPLLSDQHFSVDGTLIEAWAGHKSFKPKDDTDGDGEHFHGTTRMKARPIPTAASTARVRERRANSVIWDTPRWKIGAAWPSRGWSRRPVVRRNAQHRKRCWGRKPRNVHASRSARTRPMMLKHMLNACGRRTSHRTSPSTIMSRRPERYARRRSTDEPPGTRATTYRRANAK